MMFMPEPAMRLNARSVSIDEEASCMIAAIRCTLDCGTGEGILTGDDLAISRHAVRELV